uniref:F-box domain-containing protein n=1 Tax=Panagrolaimus sp. PS1159 TaxID=55785 RepID=A0AC35GU27_9BILA
MLTFNTDGMLIQCFVFKDPIIDYIFKNLKPEHLIKLYQCCKFFYSKFRLNIIRRLAIVNDDVEEILNPTITIIRASNTALKKLADFWISDSLSLTTTSNVQITLPTFSRCTIKKLVLCDCVKLDEFLMLTKAGTIEEMKIKGVFAEDGVAFIPIEDIINEVPNAKSITKIYESFITPTTFSSLVSLKHRAKLSKLVLINMTVASHVFKHNLMVDFVLKNADDVCNVLVGFEMVPEINDLSRQINCLLKKISSRFNHLIVLLLKQKKEETS